MQRFLLLTQVLLNLYLCSLAFKGFDSLTHAGIDVARPMRILQLELHSEVEKRPELFDEFRKTEETILDNAYQRLHPYSDHSVKIGFVSIGVLIVCVMQIFVWWQILKLRIESLPLCSRTECEGPHFPVRCFSIAAACSGVSTPGLSSSVRTTRMRVPFSRARSCSRLSVCSRRLGGQETN